MKIKNADWMFLSYILERGPTSVLLFARRDQLLCSNAIKILNAFIKLINIRIFNLVISY